MAVKVGPSAALVAVLLAGCTSWHASQHVSLKDTQPQIIKPVPPKAKASPFALAPVVVTAPTAELATQLETQITAELAAQGYPTSPTGTWRIMGTLRDQPASASWTVINHTGAHVGTVSQSNPNASLASSTNLIASTAATSIVRLLPHK